MRGHCIGASIPAHYIIMAVPGFYVLCRIDLSCIPSAHPFLVELSHIGRPSALGSSNAIGVGTSYGSYLCGVICRSCSYVRSCQARAVSRRIAVHGARMVMSYNGILIVSERQAGIIAFPAFGLT